jgi:hypothetical protein
MMPARNFQTWEAVGDIVAINGKPMKGTWYAHTNRFLMDPNPGLGQMIADVTRRNAHEWIMEILGPDGSAIGTIMGYGWDGGAPPPGAPARLTNGNLTITGGTGAYVGIRGQMGPNNQERAAGAPAYRGNASMTEDPFFRRINGPGQTLRHVLQIYPMLYPEILANDDGFLALHAADFSPVTPERPARAGEVLILATANLGPVRPNVEFGQPFPSDPPAVAISPVEVVMGGKDAEVVNQEGRPGSTNRFRLDFRVPEGVPPGMAQVQVRAAFINGTTVLVPVQ